MNISQVLHDSQDAKGKNEKLDVSPSRKFVPASMRSHDRIRYQNQIDEDSEAPEEVFEEQRYDARIRRRDRNAAVNRSVQVAVADALLDESAMKKAGGLLEFSREMPSI